MSRRAARLIAVEVLYAADVRGADPAEVLAERDDAAGFAVDLVTGTTARRAELDELITKHSIAWRIDRMSSVDRNILRVGVFELLEGEVPPAAVMDEAVEIAKRYSGEEAGRFVNGVLAAIYQEVGGGEGGKGGGGGVGPQGSVMDGGGSDGAAAGGGSGANGNGTGATSGGEGARFDIR